MTELFVSYSRDDTVAVMTIVENLRKLGFDLWIDVEHLTPGTPAWAQAIEDALERSDGVLAFISPTAKTSRWCNIEITTALDFGTPIYPILLSGDRRSAVPMHLKLAQYTDMRGRASRTENLEQLIDTLTRDLNHTTPDHQVEEDSYGRPVIQINVTGTVEGHINVIGGDNIGTVNVAGQDINTQAQQQIDPEPVAIPTPVPLAARPALASQSAKVADRVQRTLKLTEPPAIIIASIIGGLFALGAVLLALGAFDQNNTPDEPESEPVVASAEQEPEPEEEQPTEPPSTDMPEPTPLPTEAETAPELIPVTRNADWEPVIQEFNGVEMALVPVGCFMMGSEDGDSDEAPVHEVCFDEPFWIDIHEVTNAQIGTAEADYCLDTSSETNHPRICISQLDASVYCHSRDTRLPTEAEWEYAARGPDNLIYPWGNEFIAELSEPLAEPRTAVVMSNQSDISWVGTFDMSGNVSEWVQDRYIASYDLSPEEDPLEQLNTSDDEVIARGGSWQTRSAFFRRSSDRHSFLPELEAIYLGFRCASSYTEIQNGVSSEEESETATNDSKVTPAELAFAAYLHEGPDPESILIDLVEAGTSVDILGRDYYGFWLYVRTPNDLEGWIALRQFYGPIDVARIPQYND